MTQILFNKQAEYLTLGRNGYSQAHGISVQHHYHPTIGIDEVLLEPINARKEVGRARLIVPFSHLKRLRDAIDEIIATAEQEHNKAA